MDSIFSIFVLTLLLTATALAIYIAIKLKSIAWYFFVVNQRMDEKLTGSFSKIERKISGIEAVLGARKEDFGELMSYLYEINRKLEFIERKAENEQTEKLKKIKEICLKNVDLKKTAGRI